MSGGLLAVGALGDLGLALDDAEVGHGIGQGTGDDVQPPVDLFLGQVRQQPGELGGELAQHVAVVVGQEAAEGFVVLGIGAGQDADEGRAAAAVARQVQGRADVGVKHVLQSGSFLAGDPGQGGQASGIELIEASAEYLLDQLVFRPEVVIDRGEVDLGRGGDLPSEAPAKPWVANRASAAPRMRSLVENGEAFMKGPSTALTESNDRLRIRPAGLAGQSRPGDPAKGLQALCESARICQDFVS